VALPHRKPLVAAHRGASLLAPENTLESFEQAIAVGAEMIEFDVRRTRYGELVVFHDELPATFTRRPPLLAEVVELCRGRIRLDVELKEAGVEREALALLDGDFVVTSFLDAVVASIKRQAAHVRTGLLVRKDDDPASFAARLAEARADFLAPEVDLLDAGLDGEQLCVWTVNDRPRLERYLADPRVAVLITDDPVLALELRDR
jgi:glycerophosphoryl diester phosphodiesterase